MTTRRNDRSQVGDNFLHGVFSNADPDPVGDLLARHDALLARVTVLERALEKIVDIEVEGHTAEVAQAALDA